MLTYIPSFFGFASHLGHHRALSRVPFLCYIEGSHQLFILYIVSLVYIRQSHSLNSSHSTSSPLASILLSSMFVSLFLLCKYDHLYHFSRFHIYALISSICVSLSDLLHSVRQSLGPSASLQMTEFHSFLWLSNIPLYICTTSCFSIPLLMDIQVASMSWLL